MKKLLDKYQIHITVALILFIAIGGLALLYEQQRDKIIGAQNTLKVEKEGWQREKDELSEQVSQLETQVSEIQKQKASISGGTATGVSTSNTTSTTGLIDINTADKTVLDTLPGIGETKAEAIIEYRSGHGLFKRIEDLKQVKGIGDATFEKLKDKITI
ncbi:MAG: helix-hairpin-helix domain-containing protein [bacterium]|nr:helix-hairpin-helix domain-containing protein [bacterium]